MIFIVHIKWKVKPTKERLVEVSKLSATEEGVKPIGQYWTLGRWDLVNIVEAKDEQTIMKALIKWGDLFSTETLVAVPREEAIKLIE